MNLATIALNAATIALVVIPLVILEIGLVLYALFDLFAEDRRVRGDSKIMWALIIAFASGIGPLIYFFVGRDDSRGISTGNVPAAPAASIARILATWPVLPETTDAAVSTT
ncbi:MAG TPA: PLD nuclease N-terminal domain-containing protein, partial [Candidatus Limnocylindrales bacterium]